MSTACAKAQPFLTRLGTGFIVGFTAGLLGLFGIGFTVGFTTGLLGLFGIGLSVWFTVVGLAGLFGSGLSVCFTQPCPVSVGPCVGLFGIGFTVGFTAGFVGLFGIGFRIGRGELRRVLVMGTPWLRGELRKLAAGPTPPASSPCTFSRSLRLQGIDFHLGVVTGQAASAPGVLRGRASGARWLSPATADLPSGLAVGITVSVAGQPATSANGAWISDPSLCTP